MDRAEVLAPASSIRALAKFAVIVPTLNAGQQWAAWESALRQQTAKPEKILILDSESTDGTAARAKRAGYHVVSTQRSAFDHGGTRQSGIAHIPSDVEVLVYLTQDAILANPTALETLAGHFVNPVIGMAYGRQLPRPGAGGVESHARLFNYPPKSEVRFYADRVRLGLKAAFCSNSFAAYRRSALAGVGGFPTRTILGEDMLTAAKMLNAGWAVGYVADAAVYHSHNYTIAAEFRRYFDTGVLHARERAALAAFGGASGEGMRFVRSELGYLARHAKREIPHALLRTFAKYAGYRLGSLSSSYLGG